MIEKNVSILQSVPDWYTFLMKEWYYIIVCI